MIQPFKTEPNPTETVSPLYMGKHVFRFGWWNGTEKTDFNRLQRNKNRFTNRLVDFSKTAFKPLLTGFSIFDKKTG